MNEIYQNIYYSLKPFISKKWLLFLRRKYVMELKLFNSFRWPILESAATPPIQWTGWPDGKQFALVLTHDVDTQKGMEKCRKLIELEESLGFRSSFNFVPEDYTLDETLRNYLAAHGFEVGVHGLTHNGNMFRSKEVFLEKAFKINKYLAEWKAVGFRAPSMYHNLEWIQQLDITYDSSTFDTDPFEPQPDGAETIFPFFVKGMKGRRGYVELPYTLPQDFTLFILMKERSIDVWKRKLDWIAQNGGMALMNTHPDYMCFPGEKLDWNEYPASYYEELLNYLKARYEGKFWHRLPRKVAHFWETFSARKKIETASSCPER